MSKTLTRKLHGLIRKREQARKNMKRQQRQLLKGKDVRVRPEFWLQVVMDYSREIRKIESIIRL